MTGCYYAPPELLDQLESQDQVLLRYAAGENPNGSLRRHRRASATRPATCSG